MQGKKEWAKDCISKLTFNCEGQTRCVRNIKEYRTYFPVFPGECARNESETSKIATETSAEGCWWSLSTYLPVKLKYDYVCKGESGVQKSHMSDIVDAVELSE